MQIEEQDMIMPDSIVIIIILYNRFETSATMILPSYLSQEDQSEQDVPSPLLSLCTIIISIFLCK